MVMALCRRLLLRRWPVAVPTFLLLLFVYFERQRLSQAAPFPLIASTLAEVADEVRPGAKGILPDSDVAGYVQAIIEPHLHGLETLDCHNPDLSRYKGLRPSYFTPASRTPYFFALNLRENLPILPTLLSSVMEAINFLGPEHCALSIVEGNSPDGTADVLAALRSHLARLKIRTHFTLSVDDIDPSKSSRFAALAELRNMALQPIHDEPERYRDSTIIFINDVAACADDLLELVYQRKFLNADMTCAMDWIFGSGDIPLFYDSFISRGINGDLFINVPPWDNATNVFWNDPVSKTRFDAGRPVQVFACWNGAVAFSALPIASGEVVFRAAREEAGECINGEPELFCKDFWTHGYEKIAVVPYVNLDYSVKNGQRIKDIKGYTSKIIASKVSPEEDRIDWQGPPEKVKCMPSFQEQYWVPWNDSLIEAATG